jgi:adenylosuccinate synthase
VDDVTLELTRPARFRGANVLFEGAQGAMLDVDRHLSVRHVVEHDRGQRGDGHGHRAARFDYVLGIVKAYTTRVGAGPFPTELFDETGEHLRASATSSAP